MREQIADVDPIAGRSRIDEAIKLVHIRHFDIQQCPVVHQSENVQKEAGKIYDMLQNVTNQNRVEAPLPIIEDAPFRDADAILGLSDLCGGPGLIKSLDAVKAGLLQETQQAGRPATDIQYAIRGFQEATQHGRRVIQPDEFSGRSPALSECLSHLGIAGIVRIRP